MPITYPDVLPRGLKPGRSYQLTSPLLRSSLANGRSIQRRRFTDVPEAAQVSWLFNDVQAVVFEAWWRDALKDGSEWFECPLDTPIGYRLYTCRFTEVYSGPTVVGPKLWSYSAELELRERAVADRGTGNFPDYLANGDIFDKAANQLWPKHVWAGNEDLADVTLNETWPSA